MILTNNFWIVDAIRYLIIIFGGMVISGQISEDKKTYIAIETILYLIVSCFFEYALTWMGA